MSDPPRKLSSGEVGTKGWGSVAAAAAAAAAATTNTHPLTRSDDDTERRIKEAEARLAAAEANLRYSESATDAAPVVAVAPTTVEVTTGAGAESDLQRKVSRAQTGTAATHHTTPHHTTCTGVQLAAKLTTRTRVIRLSDA
eukprot:CAMPEP_0182560248 /NCGR_PEP_ID=MMETSP1324-20130603/3025_1 /TAXON_ID=236786 /ORGANISM="Florenciella sp., Strain RCC1587" /LENGTH=140 /DNA_ID=CAMNT_0024772583 /DNA_START=296 /DNA_END=717 /DNA_ORIENTATION=+